MVLACLGTSVREGYIVHSQINHWRTRWFRPLPDPPHEDAARMHGIQRTMASALNETVSRCCCPVVVFRYGVHGGCLAVHARHGRYGALAAGLQAACCPQLGAG